MREINLKSTEYFEAVARLGSATKASRELEISPSAVSQQIKILESQFGVKLFRRHKQRLLLTLEGDRLYQATTGAFSALRNAKNAITHNRGVRNLTLRVSPSFGIRWLGPRIADFAGDHAEWNLHIDATPEFTTFDFETVDLDLRYGLGGWSGLNVNPFMHDLVTPLCAPDYLRHLATLADDPEGRIKNARLIDSRKALLRWDLWLSMQNIVIEKPEFPFRFDRSSMSIELAKQGQGVALESASLCLDDIKSGALVPLGPGFPVVDFPAYWFVAPNRHFDRRIVGRFYDWISREAGRHEKETRKCLRDSGCTFAPISDSNLIAAGTGGGNQ